MSEKRVVLLGGGGHASDILAAYEAQAEVSGSSHPVIGILDDGEIGERRFAHRGIRQLGSIDDIDSVGATHFVVAVGWPEGRLSILRRVAGTRLAADTIVHPRAWVAPDAEIGAGSVVLARAEVGALVRIGAHTVLSYGVLIGHDSEFGDFAGVMPGAIVCGGAKIGAGAMLGVGAKVIQGLHVGEWATVGAGSVVNRGVPAHCTAVGSPARVVRRKEPLRLAG